MDSFIEVSNSIIKPTATPVKATRVRYFMLCLVLIATVISYVDRMNLSIAAPFMTKDLGIDKVHI